MKLRFTLNSHHLTVIFLRAHVCHASLSLISNTINIDNQYNNCVLQLSIIENLALNKYIVIDYKFKPPDHRREIKKGPLSSPDLLFCQRQYFYFLFL